VSYKEELEGLEGKKEWLLIYTRVASHSYTKSDVEVRRGTCR
jgi:hypothetical protein